ncbi:MAG: hypothetical protein M3Q29_02495 [Chloroflexota bacterium]|nr:hypothetical protein [Chloroflexota bacterium]
MTVLLDALLQGARHQQGWMEAIIVADFEFGRKQLLIRLAERDQPFVKRLTPDINVRTPEGEATLDRLLAAQPFVGEASCPAG